MTRTTAISSTRAMPRTFELSSILRYPRYATRPSVTIAQSHHGNSGPPYEVTRSFSAQPM
ncbi:Uncharacterised protein [Mycobacteroides abscessus subsp. abscessus]|nr:Uncharacterised protein [Mycobacteroides abscessus subsp. abscessus]